MASSEASSDPASCCPATSESGCTANADGSLKEAHEIEFEFSLLAAECADLESGEDNDEDNDETPQQRMCTYSTAQASGKSASSHCGGTHANAPIPCSQSHNDLGVRSKSKSKSQPPRKKTKPVVESDDEDCIKVIDIDAENEAEVSDDEDGAAEQQLMMENDMGRNGDTVTPQRTFPLYSQRILGRKDGSLGTPCLGFTLMVPWWEFIFAYSYHSKYKECCHQAGIVPASHCIPEHRHPQDAAPDITLEQFGFNLEERPLPFNKENLLDHIVELVIKDDQFLHTVMKDSEIPHHTKLHETILENAQKAVEKLKAKLMGSGVPGKISFTFNAWTSEAYDPYFALTVHYIYSLLNEPSRWTLEGNVIRFSPIIRDHSGRNTA
ncbi:hypothetical protein M422DRAFT_46260 [Sphaerobolus stellatus SS14]|uniref:Uncharacterized protein n=1 Tax=Sphaerobolus stellatus (strain SS14) TaxID=990650 RepID=A0A0C9UTS7_SPHS4|nr:hypothetical protein M422DRAFT_46260 [Sphaerobolus stellatus SS14]